MLFNSTFRAELNLRLFWTALFREDNLLFSFGSRFFIIKYLACPKWLFQIVLDSSEVLPMS